MTVDTVALIKQASKQNRYNEKVLKGLLSQIALNINSTKIKDICDELYKQYLDFKANKTQFNELSLFLNLEMEKIVNKQRN